MLARIFAVAQINLLSLRARWPSALVVIICLAGVGGVFVAMLGMARGFDRSFESAGRDDRVVVISTGETSDLGSSITREQGATLRGLPGYARDASGAPLTMLERYTLAYLPGIRTGADEGVILRGVGSNVLQVRPEARIVQGRMFTPGLRELVAGRAAQGQYRGLSLGARVELSGIAWTVVGVFTDRGSAHESETWADVEVVMSAYNQPNYSALVGLLPSAAAFAAYKDAVTAHPQLTHTVFREREYNAAQTAVLSTAMHALGYAVAAIMALGAVFAAFDTMYATLEARSVEVATLRALGFDGFPIVAAMLIESVALCVAGALLGAGLAWLLFNGYSASTLNGLSQSRVAFAFSIGPDLFLEAVLAAGAVGILGSIVPAVRAAVMPVIESLRAT